MICNGFSKFEIGQIARRQWAKQISPISNRRRIRVTLQLSSIQISAREMRPYSSGYLPIRFHPPSLSPIHMRICTRANARDKKKELEFIPQNRDKSRNIPAINMTIQITDTAGRIGRPRIYSYLGQEQKGIERFRSPFPCPIWETRDASLRQMNSRRLLYRSVYPSRSRTLAIFTDARTRIKRSIRCTRNADRIRKRAPTAYRLYTHTSPLTRM